ncbi:MAG: hypothetical protein OK439_01160, partial [Thaumarchaeota archaeon]|nr:hypothetical protein [Nitrososphaerota archaeon]
SHFDRTVDMREASKSLVHLCTDKSITMNELVTSIGGLSGVLGSGTMQIEYGLSANSSSLSTAIIMATGFSVTKFDHYDPVDQALRGRSDLENDFDQFVELESLLPNLETE